MSEHNLKEFMKIWLPFFGFFGSIATIAAIVFSYFGIPPKDGWSAYILFSIAATSIFSLVFSIAYRAGKEVR